MYDTKLCPNCSSRATILARTSPKDPAGGTRLCLDCHKRYNISYWLDCEDDDNEAERLYYNTHKDY